MQRCRAAVQRFAIALPSTLCRRFDSQRRALPTPSESIRCHCRAAQLRAGECLAVAKLNCADAQRSLLCLCESAQCRCLACPHYAAAPRAVELPCAIAMPSLPRRSPATQRLAHALRFIAQPCPCYATQRPSIATPFMAKAEVRLSLPAQLTAKPPHCRAKLRHRGSVPSIALASRCYAAARFCDSVPRHRIAKPRPCIAPPCFAIA